MDPVVILWCCFSGLLVLTIGVGAHVHELDDRILEAKNQGPWLVEFYAPWCGHCQKLAPVWVEVGSKLAKSNPSIRVGKLDGTRFSSVMNNFDVRGFPTIKFLHGDKDLTHRGSRTIKDIIDFAVKANGPAVRKMTKTSEFKQAVKDHKSFFLLVTDEQNPESDLSNFYSTVAEAKILESFYYQGSNKVLPADKKVDEKDLPALIVFKDKKHYKYEVPDGGVTEDDVKTWIMNERFQAFPLIENNNINLLAQLDKFLVLALTNPSVDNHKTHPHYIMKDTVRQVALESREQFHEKFQFGFMENNDIANDITLSQLERPGILVVNPDTFEYYTFEEPLKVTVESLKDFLVDIEQGNLESFGGNSWYRKIYRVIYEVVKSLVSLWMSSPILTTGLLVIPSFLMIFICYSIWSADPYDETNPPPDSEEEEEDEDMEGEEEGKVVELEDEADGHLKSA